MIKEKKILRQCSVTGMKVNLAAFYYQDDRDDLKTPLKVEGCDSTHQCKVGSGESPEWSNCPYFGKEIKFR